MFARQILTKIFVFEYLHLLFYVLYLMQLGENYEAI